LAFWRDGKVLASGGVDGMVRIWDLGTKEQIAAINTNEIRMLGLPGGFQVQDPATMFPNSVTQLVFSPNGRLLAGVADNGSGGNKIRVWETQTGHEIGSPLAGDGDFISALAFHSKGERLASGTINGGIRIWDLRKASAKSFSEGNVVRITSLVFDAAGKKLISGAWDGQIKIWDLAAERELIAMTATGPADWLVFTPDGLFDGTANAIRQVGWRVDGTNEVVPIEAFYNDFFNPGVFSEISAGNQPKVALDIASTLQIPGLRTMLSQNFARIATRDGKRVLCFDESPTADPMVFEDGAQATAFDRSQITRFGNDGTCQYRLPLADGRQYELIDSRKSAVAALEPQVNDGKASEVGDSTLYVQMIAIDNYPDASGFSRLSSSVAGAEALRRIFEDDSKRQRMPYAHTRVEEGLYEAKATANGIRQRLVEIAQSMKEEDVLFLFFSGHGIVPSGQEMFFFAPWDIRGPDPQLESESGFSTAMLAEAIRDMPSRRIFIVIDACQSGGALESLAKVAQAKTIEFAVDRRMLKVPPGQDEYAIYIAASATPLQRALQNGPMGSSSVVALIEALRRSNGGGTMSAREVVEYIRSRTPKIAAIGEERSMVIDTGVDFPLIGPKCCQAVKP
jgi:hypothetical protein